MSFSLDAVRKYGPPLEQKVNELSKLLAKVQSDNQTIETDDIVGKSDTDHSLLRFYDELSFYKKFDTSVIGTTGPKLVFEPDYDKLSCWLRFNHLGSFLDDYSGFSNKAEIFGEPCLDKGIDLGFYGGPNKSVSHKADSTATIYYRILDTAKIRIVGKTVGHSIFLRFNAKSLAQQNARDPCLYQKYDDASNGVSVRVDPNGAVKYFVRRAGTDFYKKTVDGVITINTDIDLVLTYTVSGNVSACYVNGVTKTLSTLVEAIVWETDTNAFLWARPSVDKGFVYAKPMDFRFYDEKVLTSTQALNLFTNKISISTALFGEVACTDGCIMPRLPVGDSFTPESFSTTSFT